MLERELRNNVVSTMQSWIGKNERDGSFRRIIDIYNGHRPLPRGYKVRYKDEWCAVTVSAAGIVNACSDIIPPECGCGQQIDLFKRLGRWMELDAYRPCPGDVIYYDWQDSGCGDNHGWPDHVGMVERAADGCVYVIEGNRHEAVDRRQIPLNARYIRGYGCPDYKYKAAEFSIWELTQKRVINSPDYWVQLLRKKKVPYLDDLLCKASEAIRRAGNRTGTVEEGVQRLMRAGVINSPDYWLNMAGKVPNVGELIKALGGSV